MKKLLSIAVVLFALPAMAQSSVGQSTSTQFGIHLTILEQATHNLSSDNHPRWPNSTIQHSDEHSVFQMVNTSSAQAQDWLLRHNASWAVDASAPTATGEWVATINTPNKECLKVHALADASNSNVRIQTFGCF